MTSRSALIALSAIAALAVGGTAQAAQFVQNGSFETTSAPGSSQLGFGGFTVANWSTTSTFGLWAYNFLFDSAADATGPGAAGQHGALKLWKASDSPDGGDFIGSDPDFRGGPLTQTIHGLTAGDAYQLTFDFAGAQQAGFNGVTTEGWNVSLGGTTFSTSTLTTPNHGFTPWQTASFKFVATGPTETLKFMAFGGPSASQPPFALLDGVSLTGVPEPTSWALMILGFGGIGASVRRRRSAAATA
jgi:hypothetical protein